MNKQDKYSIIPYSGERDLPYLTALIEKDLSEPYTVYTYRYFLNNWKDVCMLAWATDDNNLPTDECIGAIVCKLENGRGYMAMLAVKKEYRRMHVGLCLVKKAIIRMKELGAIEIFLETEVTNHGALKLYENLGFVRDKRLYKYYLNGLDALRLRLWFHPPMAAKA